MRGSSLVRVGASLITLGLPLPRTRLPGARGPQVGLGDPLKVNVTAVRPGLDGLRGSGTSFLA